jgi:hypothetical protein
VGLSAGTSSGRGLFSHYCKSLMKCRAVLPCQVMVTVLPEILGFFMGCLSAYI